MPCSSTHLYNLRPFDAAACAENDHAASSKTAQRTQPRFFKRISLSSLSHCEWRATPFLGAIPQSVSRYAHAVRYTPWVTPRRLHAVGYAPRATSRALHAVTFPISLHARQFGLPALAVHILHEFGQTDDGDDGNCELLANLLHRGQTAVAAPLLAIQGKQHPRGGRPGVLDDVDGLADRGAGRDDIVHDQHS